MSVHDAEPGDIYAEPSGKLWRIVGVCREPTVIAEEVEGHLPSPPNYAGAAVGMVGQFTPMQPTIIKSRMSGGVYGLMWEGFRRIWRAKSEDAAS